jgi:hypothetical protein
MMSDKAPAFALLDETNYHEWAFFMEAVLIRKDLLGVVDGSVIQPLGSPNSKPVKTFFQKKKLARAEIILRISPSQLPHVRDPDPQVIWDNLRTLHQSRGFASRLSLRRRFITMKKGDKQSIQSWVADVRRVAFQLSEIDSTVPDEDIILVLTAGLPPSYESFIISLDAVSPDLLTLDFVISRLLNEEARQDIPTTDSQESQSVALAATRTKTPLAQITCFKCQKKGHYQSNCPDTVPEIAATAVPTGDYCAMCSHRARENLAF